MKKYKATLFALSLLACVSAVSAYAAEKAPVIKGTAHPLGEALLREITERGRPSETQNIEILTPLLGTWDYTASIWTATGVKPVPTMGTITNEMILENRFLSGSENGVLNVGGHDVAVKGQGLIGYDNAKKSFTSVWIDTLSTGMMIGSGKFDKKNKAIKETGRFTNPFNGIAEEFRSELRFVDTNHYSYTIFTIGKSGKEAKLMEFEYSKKR